MAEYEKITVEKRYKQIQVPRESIYNLVNSYPTTEKKSQTTGKTSQRYQSKYSNSTKKFYDSNKRSHETMGHAKVPLKQPAQYLKKHAREQYTVPEGQPFECLNKENKKPPVPKSDDEAPPIFHDKKDFVELNRAKAVKKAPSKPPRKMVDNQKGDSFFLEFSGLVPKFVRKKEFGETPRYLVRRKQDIGYSNGTQLMSSTGKTLIQLSREERHDLLEGLRANWEQLYQKYMTLPLMIDTKSLRQKKLELERKLDLLEHDIFFLEKNEDNDIYILPG